MACTGNVYVIQNPLWNERAEQGEAAYGEDFDTKVGVFDTRARIERLRIRMASFSIHSVLFALKFDVLLGAGVMG